MKSDADTQAASVVVLATREGFKRLSSRLNFATRLQSHARVRHSAASSKTGTSDLTQQRSWLAVSQKERTHDQCERKYRTWSSVVQPLYPSASRALYKYAKL